MVYGTSGFCSVGDIPWTRAGCMAFRGDRYDSYTSTLPPPYYSFASKPELGNTSFAGGGARWPTRVQVHRRTCTTNKAESRRANVKCGKRTVY